METAILLGWTSTSVTTNDLIEPGLRSALLALVGVREVQGSGAARPGKVVLNRKSGGLLDGSKHEPLKYG